MFKPDTLIPMQNADPDLTTDPSTIKFALLLYICQYLRKTSKNYCCRRPDLHVNWAPHPLNIVVIQFLQKQKCTINVYNYKKIKKQAFPKKSSTKNLKINLDTILFYVNDPDPHQDPHLPIADPDPQHWSSNDIPNPDREVVWWSRIRIRIISVFLPEPKPYRKYGFGFGSLFKSLVILTKQFF